MDDLFLYSVWKLKKAMAMIRFCHSRSEASISSLLEDPAISKVIMQAIGHMSWNYHYSAIGGFYSN